MTTVWFIFLAVALVLYAVLDGFDLGAGFVAAFVARTPDERRTVIHAIGPFWHGHEVWLLAVGGILFAAFPRAYSASFAGFYLPLMIVLWLLILRGIAIEFGKHLSEPLWRGFWDAVFATASMLLALFFGVAVGNLVRGVPLNDEGEFFLPLWSNFSTSAPLGVLDWYTVTVAVTAAVGIALHGALWIHYRTDGALQDRAAKLARRLAPLVGLLAVLTTAATFAVRPGIAEAVQTRAWIATLPLLALAGLALAFRPEHELRALLGSSLLLAGLLGGAAASIYPAVLPAHPDPSLSLTIVNASSSPYSLSIAVYWWVPSAFLTCLYFVFLYRQFVGKV